MRALSPTGSPGGRGLRDPTSEKCPVYVRNHAIKGPGAGVGPWLCLSCCSTALSAAEALGIRLHWCWGAGGVQSGAQPTGAARALPEPWDPPRGEPAPSPLGRSSVEETCAYAYFQ